MDTKHSQVYSWFQSSKSKSEGFGTCKLSESLLSMIVSLNLIKYCAFLLYLIKSSK